MEMKELQDFYKYLDRLQDCINGLWNLAINIEKELNPDILTIPVGKTTITTELLKETREISFKEFNIEVQFPRRISNAISRNHNIHTLEDLYYEVIEKNSNIRNIGEKAKEEIEKELSNMHISIDRIKRRRKNIDKYNQPLNLFIYTNLSDKLRREYRITTLKELYESYISESIIVLAENERIKVEELLRRY